MVAEVLKRAQISKHELQGIAYGRGPGSLLGFVLPRLSLKVCHWPCLYLYAEYRLCKRWRKRHFYRRMLRKFWR